MNQNICYISEIVFDVNTLRDWEDEKRREEATIKQFALQERIDEWSTARNEYNKNGYKLNEVH